MKGMAPTAIVARVALAAGDKKDEATPFYSSGIEINERTAAHNSMPCIDENKP